MILSLIHIFQESRLMPWLTVKENIEIHGNKIDTDKYLKMISLEEFKDAYPSQLSGGMAQRVAIARALSVSYTHLDVYKRQIQ